MKMIVLISRFQVNDSFPPNGLSYAIPDRKENEFTKRLDQVQI